MCSVLAGIVAHRWDCGGSAQGMGGLCGTAELHFSVQGLCMAAFLDCHRIYIPTYPLTGSSDRGITYFRIVGVLN